MKKSKTWQDGILKIRNGSNKVSNSDLIPLGLISSATAGLPVTIQFMCETKLVFSNSIFPLQAVLFDDKGQCLESIFIKSQVYFVWGWVF